MAASTSGARFASVSDEDFEELLKNKAVHILRVYLTKKKKIFQRTPTSFETWMLYQKKPIRKLNLKIWSQNSVALIMEVVL